MGIDVKMRGISGGVMLKNKSKYVVSLYELLKSYSGHIMKKNFQSLNIPQLPLCKTEEGIEIIKKNIHKLKDWKELSELIPKRYKNSVELKKTGIAGIFSASLELTKEGIITLMQKKSFDTLLLKQKNE